MFLSGVFFRVGIIFYSNVLSFLFASNLVASQNFHIKGIYDNDYLLFVSDLSRLTYLCLISIIKHINKMRK